MTQRYAVLLRGVNIGGRNKLPKVDFHNVLVDLGFDDVFVYINSGNAVFSSDRSPTAALVRQALAKRFGFEVPTLLLHGEQIKAIAGAIPPQWTNDSPRPDKSGFQSNVMYLFDEINTPDVIEKLGYRPEIETLRYVNGAVLQNIARADQSRGSLAKVIGTGLYSQMTVRNVNTARKLAELIC